MKNYTTANNKRPLSTQVAIRSPFIGIVMEKDDYSKVKNLLPTPSYMDTLYSYQGQKIILVYVIEGPITSHNQFRWISNIKLGIKNFFFVPLDFVDEFYITNTTDITNNIYTIKELSEAFKAPVIIYPKIMYSTTKQNLYRHICWYGQRLIHQKCFTKEAMTSAALLMNKKLSAKHSNKDLHKNVLGAYMWLVENLDGFKVGLDKVQLKQAHSKGATITNTIQTQKTKQLIEEAIATGNYTKPNGKVNQVLLAKDINLHRNTIAKYLK